MTSSRMLWYVCIDIWSATLDAEAPFVHAIEREHGLCVGADVRRQCAVLIEGRDVILGGI